MSPHRVGHLARNVLGQPEHLSYFPDGAARAITNDGCRQRSPANAITSVDVLDDFFAPLMLEIHVNVRRLATIAIEKTVEKRIERIGINRSNAERVANRRIGSRTPPLAEDVSVGM